MLEQKIALAHFISGGKIECGVYFISKSLQQMSKRFFSLPSYTNIWFIIFDDKLFFKIFFPTVVLMFIASFQMFRTLYNVYISKICILFFYLLKCFWLLKLHTDVETWHVICADVSLLTAHFSTSDTQISTLLSFFWWLNVRMLQVCLFCHSI